MFQHNSHADQGRMEYNAGFPFIPEGFEPETVVEMTEPPAPPVPDKHATPGVAAETDVWPLSREGIIPLWPSLSEMVRTMGKNYPWPQDLENMLIIRALISGAMIITLAALGLLLFSP